MCLSTGLWSVFGLDLRVSARRDTPSKTPEWPGYRCQAYRPPVIDWRGHPGTARAGWPGIGEDAMTILSDVAAHSLLAFAALVLGAQIILARAKPGISWGNTAPAR
jgi:hypothetical protein